MDGLVNLLKTTREAGVVGNTPPSVSHVTFGTQNPEAQPLTTLNMSPSSSEATLVGSGFQPHLDTYPGYDGHPAVQPQRSISQSAAETGHPINFSASSINSGLEIDDKEANILLTIFRDEMCSAFPFVVIPDSVCAQDLRRDRPFLYLAVIAISTRNSMHQQELGKVIMQQLAEKMLVNGERSMDLLLGTLTYAGWYVLETCYRKSLANLLQNRCYYHFFNVPQLTSLVSTASTLIYDLGLNKSPLRDPLTVYQCAVRSACGTRQLPNPTRTVEEQRTLLGCFYLSAA